MFQPSFSPSDNDFNTTFTPIKHSTQSSQSTAADVSSRFFSKVGWMAYRFKKKLCRVSQLWT